MITYNKIRTKVEEVFFFEKKEKIKREIERKLNTEIKLIPLREGKGFTTKYLVLSKQETYFLKVANKLSERRIKKVKPARRHSYEKRIIKERDILKKLFLLGLAPQPIISGKSYLMMLSAPGILFSDLLGDKAAPEGKKLYFIKTVFKNIKKIHNAGIVFPDLSPSNIIIYQGKIYFIDFEMYNSGMSFRNQVVLAIEKYLLKLREFPIGKTDQVYKYINNFLKKYPANVKNEVICEVFHDHSK